MSKRTRKPSPAAQVETAASILVRKPGPMTPRYRGSVVLWARNAAQDLQDNGAEYTAHDFRCRYYEGYNVVRAVITIHKPGYMTTKGRRLVANWIRRQATLMAQYAADYGDRDYRNSFRTRRARATETRGTR